MVTESGAQSQQHPGKPGLNAVRQAPHRPCAGHCNVKDDWPQKPFHFSDEVFDEPWHHFGFTSLPAFAIVACLKRSEEGDMDMSDLHGASPVKGTPESSLLRI